MTTLSEAIYRINVFLGHGRALESALTFVKFQYALIMLVSPWETQIMAFQDVELPRWAMALPFLLACIPSTVGLLMNTWGYEASRYFRMAGASMGMMVWIYILTKNCLLGMYGASVNPWCLMGILGSIWIIRRSKLGLPPPGTPGMRDG